LRRSVTNQFPHCRLNFMIREVSAEPLHQFIDATELPSGPVREQGSRNLLISAEGRTSNMEKLQIQMTFAGEILFGANPKDTVFEMRQPSSRFSFRQIVELSAVLSMKILADLFDS
jgi:hypothetical protein